MSTDDDSNSDNYLFHAARLSVSNAAFIYYKRRECRERSSHFHDVTDFIASDSYIITDAIVPNIVIAFLSALSD